MISELVVALIILAYVHKKVKFYFVFKKIKKKYNVMKGAGPVLIKKSKKIGVLFLHGFTSTPQEGESLGPYLSSKNISFYAPLLIGHGTRVEHLARTTCQDWENSALKSFDKFSKVVDKVYIVGSSLGGNLAFRIATKRKVAGIISMGTPMFFRREKIYRGLVYVNLLFRNFIKKAYHEDEKEIVKNKVQYLYFPLNCMLDVIKMTRLSERALHLIKCPVLIMQSKTDKLLHIDNVSLIYQKLGSVKKKVYLVPDSYHVFCIDKYKEIAFKEIYKFISEIEKPLLTASTIKA